MRLKKDGSPDKRSVKSENKFPTPLLEEKTAVILTGMTESTEKMPEIKIEMEYVGPSDPQELFNRLLKQNNLQLDFDVIEGCIPTSYGVIKLEKPTLVVKATYKENNVPSK